MCLYESVHRQKDKFVDLTAVDSNDVTALCAVVFGIFTGIHEERNAAAASESSHEQTRNPCHATCDEFNLRDKYDYV